MAFWPFKSKQPEPLSPEELRSRLIEAAQSGAKKQLRSMCMQYKDQVAENVAFMCKAPEGFDANPAGVDQYVQCLGAVAQCLATECNAPELWNRLCGTPEDNPLAQWECWFSELPDRINNLEHDALIAEAQSFIEQAKKLQGTAARQNEAFFNGRIGELLFHSGKAVDAVHPFLAALEVCREIGDVEGQLTYFYNLLETQRYLGNTAAAISTGEELAQLYSRLGRDSSRLTKQLKLLRDGEPLCRIVCVQGDNELELDELPDSPEGHYQFQFRRNRLSLQKATVLVQQANALASQGQLADALPKYQEANEVDPYDPDPLYQSGVCLLELGAYSKAKEAFEEVERLAPGWFRCRSDAWLAASLEDGSVTEEEFQLLRVLDDGGLKPTEALQVAQKAVEKYPNFAPFYLSLGDLQRNAKETDAAIASYRAGLQPVSEPDLESRLLCALAGLLSQDSPERRTLIERAVNLNGSLVAIASAKLMGIR